MKRPFRLGWMYIAPIALFAVLGTFASAPARAQVVFQPPPYAPPYGGPGQGYGGPGQGYPGYPTAPYPNAPGGPGFNYPNQPQNGLYGGRQFGNNQPNGPLLPQGIDQLYAIQGVNQLLLFGTEEGYETALEVVRNIDGDLDIIRTQISLVKTTRSELAGLGVTLTDGPLSAEDISKIVAARRQGKLRVADAVQIITRENTVVDALLGGNRTQVPLTIVPRVAKDGQVAVEFNQPMMTTVTTQPRDTTVAVVPGSGKADDAPVSLLLVTPTILPSDYRPAR